MKNVETYHIKSFIPHKFIFNTLCEYMCKHNKGLIEFSAPFQEWRKKSYHEGEVQTYSKNAIRMV